MVERSSTSMVPSANELRFASTGTLSSVLAGAVVPALTRETLLLLACLNLDRSAHDCGLADDCCGLTRASSMAATASVDHRIQVVGDGAAVGQRQAEQPRRGAVAAGAVGRAWDR